MSHKHFEMDYSKRSDPLTGRTLGANKTLEVDDDDEIGLPKNPFARNELPIPFPTKQTNEESDLRGWETGEVNEEQDFELSKRSKRPLVSHFREFPNTALNKESDRDPAKWRRTDEDEDEDEVGGWDKPKTGPKKDHGSEKGNIVKDDFSVKSKSQNLPILFGESKVPEPKKIAKRREDNELSGWAN